MKQVLLIGILGVYNYGCEAIIRGTVEILRKINPNIEISYASYDYFNDKKILKDLDINIIKRPSKFKKVTFQNIVWKLIKTIGFHFNRPYDSTKWVNNFDTIFSIGGDMYTLGSKGQYKKDLPEFFEKCQELGLRYVLWGASVGPFDANPEALDFYKTHLKKTDLIVAREYSTIDYLKSIGITSNVVYAPDPAYFVPIPKGLLSSKQNNKDECKKIGINLSPLSASHHYKDVSEAIRQQASTITHLISDYNYQITLIPHVISSRYWEDDLSYLYKIYDEIPIRLRNKINIIESNPGFVGLKNVLKTLDFVIAARMHCAVNAICCNVPVLFLSYSSKAKGMAKLVYGDDSRVIPITQFQDVKFLHDVIDSKDCISINSIKDYDFRTLFDTF